MGINKEPRSMILYSVEGSLEDPVLDNAFTKLSKIPIEDIDGTVLEATSGWVHFNDPYSTVDLSKPNSFSSERKLVFSMRWDKKQIPAKVAKKEVSRYMAKRSSRKPEDEMDIKIKVMKRLFLRTSATPFVYDVVWHHDERSLILFSNAKSVISNFEILFFRTFDIPLIRLNPVNMAKYTTFLSDTERSVLVTLLQTEFTEE